ncbi:type IV pilus secretin PilQ [Wenzhouxiangella sp. AB-CW3]|uniref:type IV pilus secretin family protein n=1 Tax=Wenzhouxiangella sp. AB-CW3 TaxID=2771012 RepID=UPI00168ADCD1|nr:type IV pilus secretin family protein [Wenzhouxiangella sp. AB-CW3]QOC21855.1 type IV pilus secretin PilQ [Wenzhouxiangella sp. AB-CW3]
MDSTVKIVAVLVGLLWLVSATNAAELTGVDVESAAGEIRFTLEVDGDVTDPSVFTTDEPARIVLELPGTSSRVSSSRVPVDIGPARSYTALSADGRARLVVDLSRPIPHEVEVSGNRVVLVLQTGADAPTPAAANRAPSVAAAGAYEVAGLDFRRGPDGESRVLVNLDQPGVNISVNERTGGLRLTLFNTELPQEHFQRLDVTDFATPVEKITPEQRGENVRVNIDIAGAYEHLAYQSDNQVIVEVARPPEEAPMDRELTFFEDREYEGTRMTLNFQDIQVRSLLQLIAEVSDFNIVVSDSVSGNLTLRLTNVPWDQALDIILETKNLDMRQSGNVIWIAPTAEIADREQQILRARAERQTLEPLRTAMIPVSYANADELADLIRAASAVDTDQRIDAGLLSERGSVTIDERTNTLLVNDTAERIDEIRDLVSELDRPVRQVLIESRIVIARHDFNHQLGVRFGVTGARQDSRGNLYSTSSSSTALDQINQSALENRRDGRGSSTPVDMPSVGDRLNVNLPVADPAGSLGFSLLAADFLLDLELSALESEGRGEVISTPRVITANQSEAFIQQGVEIPYEARQAGAQAGAINVEFQEAVLELRVTPLITPDNRIQLSLNVKQDTVGEIFNNIPSIDTRELGTRVLVENGQTVVLGGIYQEERNFTATKVPVLGDVPGIGRLFRQRSTSDEKRELLIFVTPQILDDRVAFD